MATQPEPSVEYRARLSRGRVLRAAVALADRDGIDSLTMRNLAQELDVEAMSLYYHVANKEAVLDGIVEVVAEEIEAAIGQLELPGGGDDWRANMRSMILAARQVLLAHPWAPAVIETRTTMCPPIIRHFEAVLGVFLGAGFSYDLAHHAMHALGSRALGFNQELFAPDSVSTDSDDTLEMMEQMAAELPNLVGMMMTISHDDPDSTLGWCDDQAEFEFGLDLMLDGLETLRSRQ